MRLLPIPFDTVAWSTPQPWMRNRCLTGDLIRYMVYRVYRWRPGRQVEIRARTAYEALSLIKDKGGAEVNCRDFVTSSLVVPAAAVAMQSGQAARPGLSCPGLF